MVTNLHIANLIYCQGCLNTIFQIIKVGQHIFKHLHTEKELIPQGFFQPFWEGVLGPFALGNFRYFNQNWENFYNHFYMIFLNRDPNITKTSPCNEHPLTSHFYIVKLGFTGVYMIFLFFALKQRLWVLVRTASLRHI